MFFAQHSMRGFFLPLFALLAGLCATRPGAVAQSCISIANLPDTVMACKNTSIQFSPTIAAPAGTTVTSTIWTPATGLSSNTILAPVVATGTTSRNYTLTATALGPDAIINGTFSAGNTGFTTGYSGPSGGAFGPLSNEGTYLVTTNPLLAHNNFASFPDHTGGTGGQMMVVNGSVTAGTSIWCQTITVTPNTAYVFTGWGASAVSSSAAQLQFLVNGTPLGSATTLPLTNGLWTSFGGVWNSGTATSVTVCITNLNTANSGNDFAIDDIGVRAQCSATDSVYLRVINVRPTFTAQTRFGCDADTVVFDGSLLPGSDTATTYSWSFGDGTTATGPDQTHVYTAQGLYTVKLFTSRSGCLDSATQIIDLNHPLEAAFTQSADTVCQGSTITFSSAPTQAVIRNGIAPRYFWSFGDGTTDTARNPTHTYAQPGTYPVYLAVRDFVPCADTAYGVVIVDSLPYVRVATADTALCVGKAITLQGTYLAQGARAATWIFGDGTTADGLARPSIPHGYAEPGTYDVYLLVDYRFCPDTADTASVVIRPFAAIDLGPDTSLCPGGAPVHITARLAGGIGDGPPVVIWNTRDTAQSILARLPGVYWAQASLDGCTSSDTVIVAKDCYLDVPNVFTPNGDGLNDYFLPRQLLSAGVTAFSMQVYNRWGEKVWQTTSLDGRGWDGRFGGVDQPTGVYVYLIEVTLANGRTERYGGNVTLMR